MSGFFGGKEAARLGGLFKQAMSDVENTFDTLLKPSENRPEEGSSDQETSIDTDEQETIMDPISGVITTVTKQKAKPKKASSATTPTQQRSDISSRLAAAVAEKSPKPSPNRRGKRANASTTRAMDETRVAQDSASLTSITSVESAAQPAVQPTEYALDGHEESIPEKIEIISSPDRNAEAIPVEKDSETELALTENEKSPKNSLVDIISDDLADIDEKNVNATAVATDENLGETGHSDISPPQSNEATPVSADAGQPLEDSQTALLLQEREKQLLQIVSKNAELHEQIQIESKRSADRIQELEKQLSKANQRTLPKNIKDLEEKIEALMFEGEKLSKKELQLNTTIKKLRAEKNDQDKTFAGVQKKLDKATADLLEANTSKKQLKESKKSISSMADQQAKHIEKLEADRSILKSELSQKETDLMTANKNLEIARASAKTESDKVHAAALEKETAAKIQLQKKLDECIKDAETKESELESRVQDLETSLELAKKDAEKDISDLQEDLRLTNTKLEELERDSNDATAPFLMQIEELQNQCFDAKASQEKTEKEKVLLKREHDLLLDRLEDTQRELISFKENTTAAQSQLTKELKEKAILQSKIEDERQSVNMLSDMNKTLEQEKNELVHRIEMTEQILQEKFQKQIEEERKHWQVKMKKLSMQASKPKKDVPKDETIPAQLQSEDSPTLEARSSSDNVSNADSLTDTKYRQLTEFYEIQLATYAQTKEELEQEMQKMTLEIDSLREKYKEAKKTETEHQLRDNRYQASLELLGERTEQVEELKEDIADLKEMYRNQIDELVRKIDQLSKK